jgi:hypothetical protein
MKTITAPATRISLCRAGSVALSEFHAGRQGTATELAMLARLGTVGRTIAVVSKATDLQAVSDTKDSAPDLTPKARGARLRATER